MDRRTLLKIMGGIAALPALGKAIKGAGIKATKVAGKVLPKVAGMPEWFNPLVSKIIKEGSDISPKIKNVEDMTTVKRLEIPSETGKSDIITLTQNKVTGEISIESNIGGIGDTPFELNYRPPKLDIDVETGKQIKTPGEFSVIENRPRALAEPGDFEFDYDTFNINDAYSDVERLEKIGTGKIKDVKKIEQRAKGRKMVEESPYEDIMNRYPDPIEPDFDYANGGIASFANGGKAKNKSKAEEPLSKYKSYSENELLSSLDAKMPNLEIVDDELITMPMFKARDIVPKDSVPVMPYERFKERQYFDLAKGGFVNTGLTKTVPPAKGPDSQGVETLFRRRYS
jgi:hypothetical protein